jgi:hypothetical protein
MSPADSQKYERLEETAKKWYDIEAQNVKDLAQLQATAAGPGHRVKAVAMAKRFSIGYLPTKRALVLKNFYKGNLILTDLRGRVVSRFNLSDLLTNGNGTVSLPASLSTGLYIAGFKGVNGSRQTKIFITQ